MLLRHFAKDVSRRLTASNNFKPLVFQSQKHLVDHRRSYAGIFEPEYLDHTGPVTPLYDLVNVQIKGYDFPVLESYQKHIHSSALSFGIDVEDSWGTPAKKLRITGLKPESERVEAEYQLYEYERNVQLADLPASLLSPFINFIEAALPPGVKLCVHPHDPDITERLYIPDFKLIELKTELEEMKSSKDKK